MKELNINELVAYEDERVRTFNELLEENERLRQENAYLIDRLKHCEVERFKPYGYK